MGGCFVPIIRFAAPSRNPTKTSPISTRGSTAPEESAMKFSTSICMTIIIALAMQNLSVGSLNAQDRDREERDHERQLRDDIRREQWRKSFNVEEYLKGLDKDKDGVLAPEEMEKSRTKRFLEKMGVATSKTSKIEDLVKRHSASIANESKEKRKEFANRLNSLPEFGSKQESFGVGQFGAEDKAEGLRTFEESATGLKASDFEPEMLEKADKRLDTFDRDKNGFLDGDEILRLSWKSPPPETSDLNRDGRLSKMELAKRFSEAQESTRKSSSSRKGDDSRSMGKGSSREEASRSNYHSRRDEQERERGSKNRRRETPKPNSSAVAKAKANAQSTQAYAKYVDRSFKKYDANSDGRLDKEELSKSSLLKKAEDTNRDGFISKQEAIALVSGGNKNKGPAAAASGQRPTSPKPANRRKVAAAATPAARNVDGKRTHQQ